MQIDEREKQIYQQYQEIVAPFIVELEVRDSEYPIEVFNEIRSIFTHISRYKLQGKEEEIKSAERHMHRAILDCFKYLCLSMAEKVKRFRNDYQNVDLKLADSGKFLPMLDTLQAKAEKCYIDAKKAEIAKKDDEEIFRLYEKAYNAYSEMDKFLDDSRDAILFASTHSKASNIITMVSFIVGVIGAIVGIVGVILAL